LIGLGQDFQTTLWIGLDWIHELVDWIGSMSWWIGLDWVSKNGPMSNSVHADRVQKNMKRR